MDTKTMNSASYTGTTEDHGLAVETVADSSNGAATTHGMSNGRMSPSDVGSAPDAGSQLAMNLNDWERIVSLGVGLVALFFLARRLLIYVVMAAIGAYLVVRGVTGHCMLYSRAHLDTRDKADSAGQRNLTAGKGDTADAHSDPVTEASRASFPASDPPSFYR